MPAPTSYVAARAALVALALPPFLTRSMTPTAFGAWALVLQLGAYVGFLDLGIQTAISRFVAQANERNDAHHRDSIVNTSLAILSALGLLAWIAALLVSAFLPHIFKQLPAELDGQVRIAFLLVAGSLAIGLPASAFIGVFVGLQRNTIPATIIAVSKIVSSMLVVFAARHGANIAYMGAIVCGLNLASYLAQYFVLVTVAPGIRFSLEFIRKSAARDLADYCFSLMFWGIGLLLVTGMDLSIVGYYRFNEVAYYSIAATITTFLGGFLQRDRQSYAPRDGCAACARG